MRDPAGPLLLLLTFGLVACGGSSGDLPDPGEWTYGPSIWSQNSCGDDELTVGDTASADVFSVVITHAGSDAYEVEPVGRGGRTMECVRDGGRFDCGEETRQIGLGSSGFDAVSFQTFATTMTFSSSTEGEQVFVAGSRCEGRDCAEAAVEFDTPYPCEIGTTGSLRHVE